MSSRRPASSRDSPNFSSTVALGNAEEKVRKRKSGISPTTWFLVLAVLMFAGYPLLMLMKIRQKNSFDHGIVIVPVKSDRGAIHSANAIQLTPGTRELL